ncbi:MAG: leucine-rich repeat domain-containing protein [Rikenellaceae bacterium]
MRSNLISVLNRVLIAHLLGCCALFYSCEKTSSTDIDTDITEEEIVDFTKLSDYSATSYPSTDVWTILDSTLSTGPENFAGLKSAIAEAKIVNKELKLTLIFENIDEIPEYGLNEFGEYDSGGTYIDADLTIISVSAPKAKKIGKYAFNNCYVLSEINLPMATTINDYAFYGCSALIELELPMAETISSNAFYECNSITSFSLPNAVKIGDLAFKSCTALPSIELPSATVIGDYAFEKCNALLSIDLPIVDTIGYFAFTECISLTSFTIPSTLRFLDAGAFSKCYSLEDITISGSSEFQFEDGVLTSSDGENIHLVLDSKINNGSFYSEKAINIDSYAFYGSSALKYITLPNVTKVGEYAFYNCSSLIGVALNSVDTVMNDAFASCNTLVNVSFPSARYIGNYAFNDCSRLSTVDFPSLLTIGSYALYSCGTLSYVDLPEVQTVGDGAFDGNRSITYISIPKATSIGKWTFYNCSSLAQIYLATSSGTKIDFIAEIQGVSYSSDIILCLGSENQEYVKGSTLTVGSYSASFKDIYFIDN